MVILWHLPLRVLVLLPWPVEYEHLSSWKPTATLTASSNGYPWRRQVPFLTTNDTPGSTIPNLRYS